jgi:hypothetical protein
MARSLDGVGQAAANQLPMVTNRHSIPSPKQKIATTQHLADATAL